MDDEQPMKDDTKYEKLPLLHQPRSDLHQGQEMRLLGEESQEASSDQKLLFLSACVVSAIGRQRRK